MNYKSVNPPWRLPSLSGRDARRAGWVFLLTLLASCGRQHGEATALLDRADSLMTVNADSAYNLLVDVQDEARTSWRRADRMRYELTLAEAMNKAYVNFTTDSVMKRVARYYDRHGSANQQLKAHYLLGCTYRDMGEAPAAINAWQEAVERADTTSTDCDYKTLYRVYGQMAELYDLQYMPNEELEAQRKVSKYALLAKDTFNYIRGIELQVNAYYLMGDSAGIIRTTEKARQLYLKNGMQDEAAKVYAAAIHVAVDKGQFLLADSLMKDYVKASGLFDKKGDIEPSREQYYYYKGMCCLASGKLDSAEMLFRKLIPVSDNTMDGYLGLLKLYQEKKDIDSTVHYAQLYESALSDYLKYTHKETVTQMKALYDYSRQVKIAQLLKSRNARQTLVFVIVAFIIILGSTATFFAIRRKKDILEWKFLEITETYKHVLKELEESKQEVSELRSAEEKLVSLQHIVKSKDRKAEQLSMIIADLRNQLDNLPGMSKKLEGAEADVVQHFHDIAKNQKNKPSRAADDEEWERLIDTIRISYTDFYLFITVENKLSPKEYQICILSFLGFTPSEMCILTSTSKYLSNVRNALAKKLFNENSAYALDKKLNSFRKQTQETG